MHIHLTEKRKFLIVPRFPEGVAKDWRIPLGDQNLEVTTDLVVRKLQSASRGRFSNLNLSWHEAILLPYGSYDSCRISNAILVGGEYSKCNMKYTRLVVEGRRESRKAPAPAQGAGGPPRRRRVGTMWTADGDCFVLYAGDDPKKRGAVRFVFSQEN